MGFFSGILQVVRMLKGEDINSSESAKKFRRQPVLKRTFSVGLIDTEEYNATRYLNDNQPIQIALEL